MINIALALLPENAGRRPLLVAQFVGLALLSLALAPFRRL